MEWRIGCSGYHYPDWKRIFYPEDLPPRKWFEYYCSYFSTLELNLTYYKFPRVDTLRRWNERSPDGFSFTVKAPHHITHFQKFKEAQQKLNEFVTVAREGLSTKLGCVLFQFPADFQYESERLSRIIDLLDLSVRNVVEFRHSSWWQPDVYDALSTANITFCGMSHPTLPEQVVGTTDTLYYRFHGVPHLYNSRYETQKLEQMVQSMLQRGGRRAFVYFNNTADAHAVMNAKELQDICELVH